MRVPRLIALMMVVALPAAFVGCRGRGDEQGAEVVPPPEEQPAGPTTQRSVLVLCYHAMAPDATSTYDVPSEDFAAQLKLIADQGYQSVTVDQSPTTSTARPTCRRKPFASFRRQRREQSHR